jgi:exonuclease SbcC
MRPLRLDLHGFTVFREPTTVDFTDADFFALVGPTGSGKSTVLDAICFALYGTVPRWNDRRAVGNALAPSAAQAKVRLVFECAGARYVATRVVRRDGKGRVATSHAGLELLPPGFDLSTLDGELTELGEPLAGTPAEMEQAVLDAVGLPYEQFTTCVVVPQGAFAEFLHAKPAARQQILVNLLGLSVYEDVQKRAAALAADSDAQLAATDRLLDELADASDEAIGGAAGQVDAMRVLATGVEQAVPSLVAAHRDAAAARAALAELDGELSRLDRVRAPEEAATVAAAVSAAAEAGRSATAAVTVAEEREEKLRAELAEAGDVAALHRLLDEYAERDRLAAQGGDFASAVGQAEAEHERAIRALDEASAAAGKAGEQVTAAEHAVEEARTADRAATLRPHLRLGEPCPVCTQQVATLPAMPEHPALAAALATLAGAKKVAEAAGRVVGARDKAARELDRALTQVRTERDALARRQIELDARLAGVPSPEAARAALVAVAGLRRDLDETGTQVRTAREAHRRAAAEAARAQDRLRAAWRSFDAVRDGLAPLGPPPANRDNLAGAWHDLTSWARLELAGRRERRAELADTAARSAMAAEEAAGRIATLFREAGVPAPTGPAGAGRSGTAAGPDAAEAGSAATRAAAVEVERAENGLARLRERREQADRMRERRAGHERQGQVAKALATHLRANNFERWLLEEALDLLVEGASRILRELSAGQYDLVHDKGEFLVVDQHDAGLRRPVRTLSGGETFQASLSLALALSEQLAGMSTGAASLESIVLDEGFGTLDAATLDTVAATLENLAARGERMVGVVTHVGALAERIPVRFEISKDTRSAHVARSGL